MKESAVPIFCFGFFLPTELVFFVTNFMDILAIENVTPINPHLQPRTVAGFNFNAIRVNVLLFTMPAMEFHNVWMAAMKD